MPKAAGPEHPDLWVWLGVEAAAGKANSAIAELDPAVALAVE
jgi:hypothetical protein